MTIAEAFLIGIIFLVLGGAVWWWWGGHEESRLEYLEDQLLREQDEDHEDA